MNIYSNYPTTSFQAKIKLKPCDTKKILGATTLASVGVASMASGYHQTAMDYSNMPSHLDALPNSVEQPVKNAVANAIEYANSPYNKSGYWFSTGGSLSSTAGVGSIKSAKNLVKSETIDKNSKVMPT